MKHQLLAFAVLLLGSRASATDAQQQHPLLQDGPSRESHPRVVSPGLDAYIEGLMEQWHVPGLAIAIVDGDKTWEKGYGYAALNSTPVTPHTLFSTGSTTKSFVAAGLSLLIDNATANSSAYYGLTWKTPVSSVLRDDFVLSDDWATAHVTLEDALSHRTGYPRHDLATAATPRDTVRLLRHLPLAAEPRTAYLYCNK
ncbi:beta-lactamase-domain-containing protein, partial [Colletotrichum falcatum]